MTDSQTKQLRDVLKKNPKKLEKTRKRQHVYKKIHEKTENSRKLKILEKNWKAVRFFSMISANKRKPG